MSDLHSLAYAYVIGALTPVEAREFERHVIECDACSAEVVDVRAVASALSTTVAVDPPTRLRAAVLTQIRQTAQLPTTAGATPFADARATVTPIRPSRRPRVSTSLLAAAAVVAVVGFGGWAYEASQDPNRLVQQAASANEKRTELASLTGAGDVRTVSGRFAQTDHTATVVMSQKRAKAMLVASGLPALPDDKVYEAWTVDRETPEPAGTFTPTGDESIVTLTDATLTADSIAITVEPTGGSDKPTTDIIFLVRLPQA